ncbi:MAG TPA: GNAT family protein [Gemmatimonadales bacterium]|nr:GNAT family protein [Gemmatimonadales bacterium]
MNTPARRPALLTGRLELVPASVELTRAALDGAAALSSALGVQVPASWPPEHVDPPVLEFTLRRLVDFPLEAGWWLHFIVLADNAPGPLLIGTAGYKGAPSPDGTVEIGYSIVPDHRRRGYASEATRALVRRAFDEPSVRRVTAETLPELTPSIGVLLKCGFRLEGEGSEPGVIRYQLTRDDFRGGTVAG